MSAREEPPAGWTKTTVGEVGRVQLGRQRSPKNHSGPHMRPYLRVANVFEDRIDIGDVMEMNFTPAEYEVFKLEPGDILLNEGQSLELVGRPAMYRGELPGACFTNSLVRFQAGPLLDPKFALYVFLGYLHTGRFQRIATNTVNIAHLGAGRFADMDFWLPPRPEQERIVSEADELFSDLNAGVASLRLVKANLKRYRASVLKAAVEGMLTEEWRKKNPQAEDGQMLLDRILRERRENWERDQLAGFAAKGKEPPKNWQSKYEVPSSPDTSELPELPDGWAWATVQQLITDGICNGISVKGSDSPPGVPALRLNAMTDSGFDYNLHRYIPISEETAGQLAVQIGDFYVSRGNGSLHLVGRGVLAQHPPFRVVFPDTMIRLRFRNQRCQRSFVALVWQSRTIRRQVEKRARTTAGIHKISQADVGDFALLLPSLAEQEEIVRLVEGQLSQIDAVEKKIDAELIRSKKLRQCILEQAFEGKLVSQNPNEEPASVPLKKLSR